MGPKFWVQALKLIYSGSTTSNHFKMGLFVHLGQIEDILGSFEDGRKSDRVLWIFLGNPGVEIELPWSTKTPRKQLLEQLETEMTPFWKARIIGNPKKSFLVKQS